ncbi:hypothetical protein DSECCO2_555850 [anaerobic digester metagenome]
MSYSVLEIWFSANARSRLFSFSILSDLVGSVILAAYFLAGVFLEAGLDVPLAVVLVVAIAEVFVVTLFMELSKWEVKIIDFLIDFYMLNRVSVQYSL